MSPFDIDRIVAETLIEHIEYRVETSSTNDLAIDLVRGRMGGLPCLTLADRQTKGRGRGVNRWWAGTGALTFSLTLDTVAHQLAPRVWPKLSLTVGISVCEALETFVSGHSLHLKWPNDVYLNARKVCGVLVETIAQAPGIIVIGVGINVNNSLHEASEELQQTATSLLDVTKQHHNLTDVLIHQLQHMERRLVKLAEGDEQLAEVWRSRCMLEGRTLTIDAGNRRSTGVCHGIDDEGALLLQTEGGIERCFAGVVSKIW